MHIFLFIFLLVSPLIFAQKADNYAFGHQSTQLIDMTGSQLLIEGNQRLVSSAVVPMGFEFWFMGRRFTDFSVNTNGIIRLGKIPLTPLGNSYNLPDNSRIVAFSSLDLIASTNDRIGTWATSSTGKVHYKVLDTPQKILVVEWKDLRINYNSPTTDGTFQILLYENGKIEMRYAQMKSNLDLNNVVVGIGAGDKLDEFKGVNITTLNAQIGTNVVANAIKKGEISPLNSPQTNQRLTFSFTPPKPIGSATQLQVCIQDKKAQLQWKIPPQAQHFLFSVIYKSENGKDFEYLTHTKNTNLEDSEIVFGKTYFYKVHLVSEGTLSDLDNSALRQVSFTDKPTLDWQRKYTICLGESLTITAPNGFSEYLWANGKTTQSISLQPTQNQNITIKVKQGECLQIEDSLSVEVLPALQFEILGEKNICQDFAQIQLQTQQDYEVIWISPSQKNILGKNLQTDEHGTWTLRVSQEKACTVERTFYISRCCEAKISVPNAFTPFQSQANNFFQIAHQAISQFQVSIYNRWGELVFFSQNPDFAWDGTQNGKKCAADVYQVLLSYATCRKDKLAQIQERHLLYLLE